MDVTGIIRDFYDQASEHEWDRIDGRPEFLLTCRFLDRYIHPGDTVLDIGGGPGRYSMYLAQRGAEVTLLDLSPGNVAFAGAKARELGLSLRLLCGDARQAGSLVQGTYDHVLLMGPLYHLLEEADRELAVSQALSRLKEGGLFYASFISMFAGYIYAMKEAPEIMLEPGEEKYIDSYIEGRSFAGPAFTQAFFIQQREVLPFMERFPMEKVHLFSQEGILSPCEHALRAQPPEVYQRWLDLSERLCEREELLSWAEHFMYIGRKH